jgi:hypothetical protein
VVIDTGPKEIRSNQTLFGVEGEVCSKNDLTEPALLEMSGYRVNPELTATSQNNSRSPVPPTHFTVTGAAELFVVPSPSSPFKSGPLHQTPPGGRTTQDSLKPATI